MTRRTILPTVTSRCARFRLGPVPVADIQGLLLDGGLADPSRAASIAVAAGGLPGVAIALARAPEALLIRIALLDSLPTCWRRIVERALGLRHR